MRCIYWLKDLGTSDPPVLWQHLSTEAEAKRIKGDNELIVYGELRLVENHPKCPDDCWEACPCKR